MFCKHCSFLSACPSSPRRSWRSKWLLCSCPWGPTATKEQLRKHCAARTAHGGEGGRDGAVLQVLQQRRVFGWVRRPRARPAVCAALIPQPRGRGGFPASLRPHGGFQPFTPLSFPPVLGTTVFLTAVRGAGFAGRRGALHFRGFLHNFPGDPGTHVGTLEMAFLLHPTPFFLFFFFFNKRQNRKLN